MPIHHKIKKPITIIEYWFIGKKTWVEYPKWSHYVNDETFTELRNFLLDERNNSEEFFSLGYKKNYWEVIIASNYVWVIQTNNGTVIEILPKITDVVNEENINKTRWIFLRMLKTLKDSPFKNLNDANLKNQKFPILEIFIQLFLQELSLLIKKWIKKNYIPEVDNLKYIKWRLKIRENIVTNIVDHSKFVCEYDEFSEDTKENRLIKTCLLKLQWLSLNRKNQQDINLFLHYFWEVSISKDVKSDLKIIDNLSRLHTYYLPTMKWVKLFLSDKSVVNFSWSTLALSLLFPMEKIFESYVSEQLKKKTDYKIDTQDSSFYLITNQRKFKLRPDIVFNKYKDEDWRIRADIIWDTKWKKIDSNDFKWNFWISQADMYQLFAYANNYKCKDLYLIYPKNENFTEPLKEFIYVNGEVLKAIPYDLEKDECILISK